jgi:hypothetical protein
MSALANARQVGHGKQNIQTGCRFKACSPRITVSSTPTITVTPVTDYSEKHYLVVRNLIGWFTTSEVDVELYPNDTLKTLGAKPQDQTAAIVVNVFKSVADIAKLAFAERSPTASRTV